jgi:hypothetical protein
MSWKPLEATHPGATGPHPSASIGGTTKLVTGDSKCCVTSMSVVSMNA